jgi:uncharacterized protein YybS (DUF2232 family)
VCEPLAPERIVIHVFVLLTLHAQFVPVITATVLVAAPCPCVRAEGEML